MKLIFNQFFFVSHSNFCRETDDNGIKKNSLSKCKMYNVNWTTIQTWDYENWNSTKNHEKLDILGKYFGTATNSTITTTKLKQLNYVRKTLSKTNKFELRQKQFSQFR